MNTSVTWVQRLLGVLAFLLLVDLLGAAESKLPEHVRHRQAIQQSGGWTGYPPNTTGDLGTVIMRSGFENGEQPVCQPGQDDNFDGLLDVSCATVFTPPDPISIASPPPNGGIGNFPDRYTFLYDHPTPVQKGVVSGVISPQRLAILRGRVLDENRSPLGGVLVRQLNGTQYGYTYTREDGRYDFVTEGGGRVVLDFFKSGLMSAMRVAENTEWQSFAHIDDVSLLPYDSIATQVQFGAGAPQQVVSGSLVVDEAGPRRGVLLVPAGTVAQIYSDSGDVTPASLNVRITEYTKGNNALERMPAPLPAASGYTYAMELSADEAEALGNPYVAFTDSVGNDRPLTFYVENFLDFPVGTVVPIGGFNRYAGIWYAEENGLVIKILSENSGMAVLDVDGSGNPATQPALDELGVTPNELQVIAGQYEPGQELWRANQIYHFSPWDLNWGRTPPDDAEAPEDSADPDEDLDDDEDEEECGSVIECGNRVLREFMPITGTEHALELSTRRSPGRQARNFRMRTELPSAGRPASLKRIEVTYEVAGRRVTRTFGPNDPVSDQFEWDGRDAYGGLVSGQVAGRKEVRFVYDAIPVEPLAASRAFMLLSSTGAQLTANFARAELSISKARGYMLGPGVGDRATPAHGALVAGVSHLDPRVGVVHDGNGRRRSAGNWPSARYEIGQPENFTIPPGPVEGALAVDTQAVNIAGIISDESGQPLVLFADDASVWRIDSTGRFRHFVAVLGADTGQAITRNNRTGAVFIAWSEGGATRVGRVSSSGASIDTLWTPTCFSSCDVSSIVLDGSETLYAAVEYNQHSEIWQASPPYFQWTQIAGAPPAFAVTDPEVPALDALVPVQIRLAADQRGGLSWLEWADLLPGSVSDIGYRIRRLDPDGVVRSFVPEGPHCTPLNGYCVLGGLIDPPPGAAPAAKGGFSVQNLGFTQLRDGRYLFADLRNQMVWQVGSDGQMTRFAGDYGAGGACNPSSPQYQDLCGNGVAPNRMPRPAYGVLTEMPDSSVLSYAWEGFSLSRIANAVPGYQTSTTSVVSQDGRRLDQFDAQGRHISSRSTLTGEVTKTLSYGPAGHLTSITDGFGNVTQFERNPAGQLTGIVSPDGQRTGVRLDAQGRIDQVTRPDNKTIQVTYTPSGLIEQYTNPRGKTSQMTYDANGNLETDTNAETGGWGIGESRGPGSRTVTLTSGEGRHKAHTIRRDEGVGVRTRVSQFPDGSSRTITRREDGSTELVARDGATYKSQRKTDPRFGRFGGARDLSVRLPSGRTRTVIGNKSVTLTDQGNPLSLSAMIGSTIVNGRTYSTAYTQSTRSFATTSPTGRVSTVTINAQEQPTELSVSGLTPVTLGYDPRGRMNELIAGARTTTMTYDGQGYVDSITDADNRTIVLTNDALGRTTSMELPDLRIVGFGYDENGNVTSITPPGRPAHVFVYDDVDRLEHYDAPSVPGGGTLRTVYDWNRDHQLELVTRPDGLTIDPVYHATTGQLTQVLTPSGTYGYTYHPTRAQVASITAPGGIGLSYQWDGPLLTQQVQSGPISGTVDFGYDNNFWLETLAVGGVTTIYDYDDDGLLTNATVGAAVMALTRDPQNGLLTNTTLGAITDTWGYNGFAEPTSYVARISGTPVLSHGFIRDALGRIDARTRSEGGVDTTEVYDYDLAGRLDTVMRNGQLVADYEFDSNSNRLSVEYRPSHALWNSTRSCLGTLSGSNPITISGSYDSQDRQLTYGSCTFTYSANGELTSRTDSTSNLTTTYDYDVFGNLRAATLPNGTQLSYLIDGQNRRIGKRRNGVLEQGFIHLNQLEPIAETDGTGSIVAAFIYADKPHVPSYMIKAGNVFRIISDHLGSVRLVINTIDGSVAQAMDYDEYGNVVQDSSPGFQPFGYAGGIYDRDLGLVRFGARDYDMVIGRWLGKDPIGFSGRDSNLYAYVGSNPVNWVDPMGLITGCEISALRDVLNKYSSGPQVGENDIVTDDAATRGSGRNEYGGPIVLHTNPAVPEHYWGSVVDRGVIPSLLDTGFHENAHRAQDWVEHKLDAIKELLTKGQSSDASDQAFEDLLRAEGDLIKEFMDSVEQCECAR